ncbi:hypothetical protein Tco_1361485 [Tanacetum coccineum]
MLHSRVKLEQLVVFDHEIQLFKNSYQRVITELVHLSLPHHFLLIIPIFVDYGPWIVDNGVIYFEEKVSCIPSWLCKVEIRLITLNPVLQVFDALSDDNNNLFQVCVTVSGEGLETDNTKNPHMRSDCTSIRRGTVSCNECMTRSSTKDLLTPFEEPERVFHSTRKLFKTTSLDYSSSPEFDLFFDHENQSKEGITEEMENTTVEEYMTITRINYESGNEKGRIELKGQFLIELCDNAFSRTNAEDAIEYIDNFLKIVDSLNIPNTSNNQLRLHPRIHQKHWTDPGDGDPSYALSWKPCQGDSLNLPDHRAQVDQGSQIKMIQVKEMMQDNDLKNSKSKDKGSRSRSQSMNEQSHYKQDKTKTRQSINVKSHIFNVRGDNDKTKQTPTRMLSVVRRSLKKETSTLGEIVSLNYIKSNKNVIGLRKSN